MRVNLLDASSIPGSGRSNGGRNGNPLQYYCQNNCIDREKGEVWLQVIWPQTDKNVWCPHQRIGCWMEIKGSQASSAVSPMLLSFYPSLPAHPSLALQKYLSKTFSVPTNACLIVSDSVNP